jgi:hypothetical protein
MVLLDKRADSRPPQPDGEGGGSAPANGPGRPEAVRPELADDGLPFAL